jgi:hypothetical protein
MDLEEVVDLFRKFHVRKRFSTTPSRIELDEDFCTTQRMALQEVLLFVPMIIARRIGTNKRKLLILRFGGGGQCH